MFDAGLPSDEAGLLELIQKNGRQIEEAKAKLEELRRESARRGRFLGRQPQAFQVDNGELGAIAKSVTLKDVLSLLGDGFNLSFFATPEGLRVAGRTLAEMIFILQLAEGREPGEEEDRKQAT